MVNALESLQVLSTLNAIIHTSMQLTAFGIISEPLLGIPPTWSILMGGFITILYTAIGGIKAVTLTDMIQFFLFMVAVLLITYKVVYHVGGIEALFRKVPAEKFLILEDERFYRYMIYFFIWLLQIGMVDPAVVQRMFIAKNKRQLRSKYMIIALFDLAFRFLVMLIGLGGLVLVPCYKIQYGGTPYDSSITTSRHKGPGYSWSIVLKHFKINICPCFFFLPFPTVYHF